MSIWEIVNKFLNKFDQEMMVLDYKSETSEYLGVICILKNNNDKVVFCFFNSDQWEMILETSELSGVDVEPIVKNIVSDLDTVVFLNPDDF